MPDSTSSNFLNRQSDYERITRLFRWLSLAVVLITFPFNFHSIQAALGISLAAIFSLYNLSRYSKKLEQSRFYMSPLVLLIIDSLFMALMLLLIGRVDTGYTGILVLILISATYWYGIKGTLTMLLGGSVWLSLIMLYHPFPPIELNALHTIVLTVLILLVIGLFTEQLTRVDRHERHLLRQREIEKTVENERLLTLINSIRDATLIVDSNGTIILWNVAVQELAGNTKSLNGQNIASVLHLHHQNKFDEVDLLDLFKNSAEPIHQRNLAIKIPDGSNIDLDITITPVRFFDIKDVNYIFVAHDITREKSLDQQRDEFISVASHELRTPLTVIEAALSITLLSKDSFTPQITLLIEQAHRNCLFLASLVKDFTTLSLIREDSIPIKMELIDSRKVIEQLVRDFTPLIDQTKLKMHTSIAPQTPNIMSTEHYIREILQNYVNNATKYSKKGEITISAHPNRSGGVIYAVKDEGIGISASDQKHLFEKFFRSENFDTRETRGSGLGLYLCHELAARLNGKVWFESKLNVGSTFYLEVPSSSHLKSDQSEIVTA